MKNTKMKMFKDEFSSEIYIPSDLFHLLGLNDRSYSSHDLCLKISDVYTKTQTEHIDSDKCIIFKYGDENGPIETILEHNDTFINLPHKRISHH